MPTQYVRKGENGQIYYWFDQYEWQKIMNEKVWIYPGSFDPLTYGHLDMIKRSSSMCDRLVIGVLNNKGKRPLFSIDERVSIIKRAIRDMKNVSVREFSGLQIDLYLEENAHAVVRGVRNAVDYQYELTEIRTNQMLLPNFEAVILLNNRKYTYVSSSAVKILAAHGGDISDFVPPFIEKLVREKFREDCHGQQD